LLHHVPHRGLICRRSIETEWRKRRHAARDIRAQMTEIDKPRTENKRLVDWIMGDSDALTCLQAVYNNPASSEGNRIKAAAASSKDPS
jgi:hypothetical protein